MRDLFQDQLESIYTDLTVMCEAVRAASERSTTALLMGDAVLAEQVISADVEVDRARDAVEERGFALLSRQAPVAGDLRKIVAALRIAGELERMGDLCVHVAKIARLRVPQIAVPADVVPTIARMAELAEAMVGVLTAIIRDRDVARTAELVEAERELDSLRSSLFAAVLSESWQHGVGAAVDLSLLGRYYERIGDHAVSSCKRITFVVTGQTGAGG